MTKKRRGPYVCFDGFEHAFPCRAVPGFDECACGCDQAATCVEYAESGWYPGMFGKKVNKRRRRATID